ncbi:MAG: hypothetical protein H7246_21865, partial [Phycisphaerae bacterium]|nr:hypothetical protein [Saprospiraceae bacterium]
SWHPLLGWAKAYPETTGYLIETLLAYAEIKQDASLRHLAFDCAKWLENIQLPSGAFPGLLAGNTRPSVFNTSQILFGLVQNEKRLRYKIGFRQDGLDKQDFFEEKILNLTHPVHPVEKAVTWLLSNLESDGAWRSHAFVPGFVPSYYTRAVWGVLQANDVLQNPEVESLMRRSLHFYAERFLPNGAVRDGGFRAVEAAFTHTLAYTLEGFLESALRLGEQEILEKVVGSLERLLEERERADGHTAGRYNEQWQGDYSFICVTGNCQLSILCQKVWAQTGEPKFKEAAHSFLAEIMGFQKLGSNKNTFGALPGSAPFWGAYLPFRYPNWAAKFFLDAMALGVEGLED